MGWRAPLCSALHWAPFTLMLFLFNIFEHATMEFYLKEENLRPGLVSLDQSTRRLTVLHRGNGSPPSFWRMQSVKCFKAKNCILAWCFLNHRNHIWTLTQPRVFRIRPEFTHPAEKNQDLRGDGVLPAKTTHPSYLSERTVIPGVGSLPRSVPNEKSIGPEWRRMWLEF